MMNVPVMRAGPGDPTNMPEDYGTQASEMTVRDYVDLLRRRKAIIIQSFVVVVAVGLVITMMAKPVYQTSTSILVEGKRWNVAPTEMAGPFASVFTPDMGHGVETQIAVITGRKVVAAALKKAGVKSGVSVQADQVGQTEVVSIICQSSDKEAAQKVALAMPQAYAEHQAETKQIQVNEMLKFARKQLASEEDKLKRALDEMQTFKTQNLNPETVLETKANAVAEVEAQIRTLSTEVAGAKASLDELEMGKRSEPAHIETPLLKTNLERDQNLRTQIAGLQTQRAGLLLRFKPEHVSVQEIDAQVKDLQKQLRELPPTVREVTRQPNPRISEYNREIAEARAVYQSKRATLAQLEASRPEAGTAQISAADRKYSELKRDVETLQLTVMSMKRSVEDLEMRKVAALKPTAVISEAGVAGQIAPRPMNNFITTALIGIVLGICLALLQEYLDDRINSPEDARRLLDAPILSYVPLVDQPDARLLNRSAGGGSLLESYRVMRSNVQFATVDSPTSSIVVTSTSPGEGKSVTATNLAIAMALDGRKVILVDADLRRPTLHEKLDVEHRPGLTNVLVGRASLEEALKPTTVPGLKLLASGPLPPNPAELLNSRAMAQVHESLREMADVVIFDSPPFLATADAQVLCSLTDGVIYVVQLGEAKKAPVKHSSELMRQAHARVLGVVFNKIDLRSRRDDYYYGYYRYYNYYHTPQIQDGKPRRRATEEFEALAAGGPVHPDLRDTDERES